MSTEVGKHAEDAAAQWLKAHGFKIIAKNWRNRWCEIDLVVKKNNAIHFIEVKYRRSSTFGDGFDYINANKIMRLKRSAQAWLQEEGSDLPFHIDVISVSGKEPFNIEFLADAIFD